MLCKGNAQRSNSPQSQGREPQRTVEKRKEKRRKCLDENGGGIEKGRIA
nr:MAG TPA: hypothetical protein [Caudoviricetes sp.]